MDKRLLGILTATTLALALAAAPIPASAEGVGVALGTEPEVTPAATADFVAEPVPRAATVGWDGDTYWDGAIDATGAPRPYTGWVVDDHGGHGLERYWIVEGRLFRGGLFDADADGWGYACEDGRVLRGRLAVVDRVYLANNDGRLLDPGWAVTGEFTDGGLQRYYIDPVTHAARTGLFEVDGATYCGLDDVGYVLRGKLARDDGRVLLADNDGKLACASGWLVTGVYDGGGLQRYWLEELPDAPGFYAARTGYFELEDGVHFGEKGAGYVLRNARCWRPGVAGGAGSYYEANNDGLLVPLAGGSALAIETYVSWMLGIAEDNAHGYDQRFRWGEYGDYDCSSLVIAALRVAGVDTAWADDTHDMLAALTASGLAWTSGTSGLRRGDILLNEEYHTAVYLGNGQIVHASVNDWGGIEGGRPGDQTGREICIRGYYDYPWDGYLRLP